MPTWNSTQYLKFDRERTQPARDLAARIAIDTPARVIDLGCGPGNSTAVLAERWPNAQLTGLDSSSAMLAAAREKFPQTQWLENDITAWRTEPAFDVVFSNAALQWVPNHRREFPRLLSQVAPGGALAVQMPADVNAPAHRVVRELAATPAWRAFFPTLPREWHVHAPEFYYDLVAPHAPRVEMWITEYLHVLDGIDGVIEWYRGTGLRPWLDALPDEAVRTQFLGAYRARLVPYFSERADSRILFPFRRLFMIAYR